MCLSDNYLLASSIYIHLNPVSAGIVKDPAGYRWSSYKLFISSKRSFLDPAPVLEILDSDLETARKEYQNLIKESLNIKFPSFSKSRTAALREFMRGFIAFVHHRRPREELDLEEMIKKFRVKKYAKNIQERRAKRFLVGQMLKRGYDIKEISKRLGMSKNGVYYLLKTN